MEDTTNAVCSLPSRAPATDGCAAAAVSFRPQRKTLTPPGGWGPGRFTDPEELHNERSLVLTATAQELARQWAQKHDVDKDSRISKEEYLSFDGNTETTFTTIDMDEDGCAAWRAARP